LKSNLVTQQNSLFSLCKQSDLTTEASFVIAWNIARSKLPYIHGEFVKKNISDVIAILAPENLKLKQAIEEIPISRHTTERRISEISSSVACSLQNDLKNCVAFSLALDESTDIQDIPQVSIFVRYVTNDKNIKEEFLDLISLNETTKGIDIKKALDKALSDAQLPLHKLVSIATDGAPAMVGHKTGLVGQLTQDPNYPECLFVHCMIHLEHLVSKHFKFDNVINCILEIVNFIRTSAKTHREFKQFILELELEERPNDLSFYCMVRWLSTTNVLKKFVALFEPIIVFVKEKKKNYPQLEDHAWVQDLMFFTDVMQHLQYLNLALQGRNKVITELSQSILSFQNKIKLFQRDLATNKLDYFPNLKSRLTAFPNIKIQESKLTQYKGNLDTLYHDFDNRFEKLQGLKPCFELLLNPFAIDVISDGCPVAPPFVTDAISIETELIDLQEDLALKLEHKSSSLTDFCKQIPEAKYPNLQKFGFRLLSVFGTTYSCESLFSIMKFVKS